jgi:hypothetical protein
MDSGSRVFAGIAVALVAAVVAACGVADTVTSPQSGPCRVLTSGVAAVTGVVTYRNTPVAGVLVAIGDHSGITTSDGSFNLTGVPAGIQRLVVGPSELGSADGDVFVLPGGNALRARVTKGFSEGFLTGRVIDSCTGQPIAGATLSGPATTTTDNLGYFSLDDLCCSTLPLLTVTRSGYQTYTTALGRIYSESRWLDVLLTPAPG